MPASWVPLGDRAIMFARPAGVSPRAIVRAARAWDGAIDVVVARDDVAVYFAGPPAIDAGQLAALASLPDLDDAPRTIELRATYDGADLAEVARVIDATIVEVVRMHLASTYVVETMGFAPGFAYLTGLAPALAQIERRATPRPRVPAGALAIAGGYTAVYPFDSPGGWNLIGRVDERMFTAEHGALLRLGDRVRFVR